MKVAIGSALSDWSAFGSAVAAAVAAALTLLIAVVSWRQRTKDVSERKHDMAKRRENLLLAVRAELILIADAWEKGRVQGREKVPTPQMLSTWSFARIDLAPEYPRVAVWTDIANKEVEGLAYLSESLVAALVAGKGNYSTQTKAVIDQVNARALAAAPTLRKAIEEASIELARLQTSKSHS